MNTKTQLELLRSLRTRRVPSEVVALYWTGWTPEVVNSGRVGQGSASV